MMEFEAGLWDVVKAGYILALTLKARNNILTAHLTPLHFIHSTPCMVFHNVRDSNGLDSE